MGSTQLLSYSFIVLLLTLTPGADTMLVLRNVFASGRRSGIITTLGICCGLFIYALITAAGISVIFTKSIVLYKVLKTVGALYLIYLGGQSLLPLIKDRSKLSGMKMNAVKSNKSSSKAFIQGLLSNLLNPKIVVFYLTFLPQFIDQTRNIFTQSLFLTGIHIVMGAIWLSFLSISIGNIRFFYTSGRLRQGLEAISGIVMIIFGLILLLEK